MILHSKALLVPSIVLLIGTVFGTNATNAFADNPFILKNTESVTSPNLAASNKVETGI